MNEDYDKLVSQCRKDCAELSATALSDKYPTEYSSWRNGKNRAKDKWSQAFVEFREFLRVLGPKPGPEYTLDRIDFADPEYAPGKVRWADKATQSENRSICIHLMHNATGQTFTLRRLAELTGRDIDDLRKAVRKSQKGGLSDDQIIEGILGASNISLSDFVTGEAASSSTLKLQALAEARENAGRTYKNPLAEFVNGAEFGIVANAVRRTAPISIPHKYSCNEEAYDQHYARMSEVEVRRARPLNGWRREYEDVYCHNKKTKIGYDNIAPSDRYVFTDVAIICQLQSIKAAWREVVSQVQNEYGFDLRALFGRRLPGQEEADFYEDLLHQPFYVEPFPGFWGSNLDRWWCYLKTEHEQISTVHKCLIVETRVWRKYTEGQRRREYNSRSY